MGTLLILSLSVGMLAFILEEKPWKDSEHQTLEILNEIFLYLVLLLVLSFSCLNNSGSAESEIFGWILVGVLTLFIQVNLVVITAQAY